MSIVRSHDDAGYKIEGSPARCFFCHETIEFPAMLWAGTAALLEHPACFIERTIRQLKDLKEILKARETPQPW